MKELDCHLSCAMMVKSENSIIPSDVGLRSPVIFQLTGPMRFLCYCNCSLFERLWYYMWRLFCLYLFLASLNFGALGELYFGTKWVARPVLIVSQSDSLIQIIDINSHTE